MMKETKHYSASTVNNFYQTKEYRYITKKKQQGSKILLLKLLNLVYMLRSFC